MTFGRASLLMSTQLFHLGWSGGGPQAPQPGVDGTPHREQRALQVSSEKAGLLAGLQHVTPASWELGLKSSQEWRQHCLLGAVFLGAGGLSALI